MGVPRPRSKASQRAQMDNAAFPMEQMRQCKSGNQEWAANIARENRIPLCNRQLGEVGGLVSAGVIDQKVEPAKLMNYSAYCGLDASFLGDVTRERQRLHTPRL